MLLQRRALVAHGDINLQGLARLMTLVAVVKVRPRKAERRGKEIYIRRFCGFSAYRLLLYIYIHISFGIMHSPMCPFVSQQWSVGWPLGVVLLPMIVIWLILPVVICLSQRLSHACLSISTCTVKLRMAH